MRVRFAQPEATIRQKLAQLEMVGRVAPQSEEPLTLRIFRKDHAGAGEVARAVGELAARERWQLEELHAEEGRLDDVFRSITLPDTTQPT